MYTICDNGIPQACSQATVVINVAGTPPLAVHDFSTTNLNTSVSKNLVSNDIAYTGTDVLTIS